MYRVSSPIGVPFRAVTCLIVVGGLNTRESWGAVLWFGIVAIPVDCLQQYIVAPIQVAEFLRYKDCRNSCILFWARDS